MEIEKIWKHPFYEKVGWGRGGRQVKMVLPDSGNRIKEWKLLNLLILQDSLVTQRE
jgi:hypothetical protein